MITINVYNVKMRKNLIFLKYFVKIIVNNVNNNVITLMDMSDKMKMMVNHYKILFVKNAHKILL